MENLNLVTSDRQKEIDNLNFFKDYANKTLHIGFVMKKFKVTSFLIGEKYKLNTKK